MVINSFQFAKTPRLIFGAKKINDCVNIIKSYGDTVLIVTGARSFRVSPQWVNLQKSLSEYSIKFYEVIIDSEPSPVMIDKAVRDFKDKDLKSVISIGGGSVIDAGKAISAMLTQDTSIVDFLEGIGAKTHNGVKLPFIAVPTTSGTGSEATKNAVISNVFANGFKASLRHDNLVPDVAILDPELTLGLPPEISAACGMDAFTQLLESYVSIKASPMTDALALSGIMALKDSLIQSCTTDSKNIEIRANMAYASYLSGVTLANAGLGVVHGIASAIGGFFNIPHGVVCGTLMSKAVEMTILKLRSENAEGLGKYAAVGRILSGINDLDQSSSCDFLIDKIHEWTNLLKISKLSAYGVRAEDFDKIIKKSGNKENPVKLDNEEIRSILGSRLG
ncbi:MAG: iron-containing alcohol dehydrogenase [Nitrospirae bacterium]|nr:iron-containing alcohol dehydrogenase [Nitrospirota bacterium]